MNLKDWEILAKIKKEGNITKAAKRAFMTQPAVTLRIRKIEEELGVKVLYRTNRGAQLTPQGEYLADEAAKLLKRVDTTKNFLGSMENPMTGTIKIGAANFMMRYKLPEMLEQFKAMHPGVDYDVRTGWSQHIFKSMQDQDIHISFVRGEYEWGDKKRLLFDEPLCIASMKEINMKKLPEMPRIDYRTDPKLEELIGTWWMENFTETPKVDFVVTRTDICREMLVTGLGYAILPKLVVSDIPNIYTVDLKDKNNQPVVRPSWMFYKESTLEIGLVRAFIDFVEDFDFDHSNPED